MDEQKMETNSSASNESDNEHSRSIVHIDIDCFYAQVEMLKDPALRAAPLGVQQKNIVVTSNYEARKHGVQKCMLVSEALRACADLRLVNGEDLHDYRTASNKIFALLQTWKCPVEKLGLDENYIDVTNLVQERLRCIDIGSVTLSGHLYGEVEDVCHCGCHTRLKVASQIASEMRSKILNDLGFTTCAGIAHNKLLAKLVGSQHKPNDQTTIFPEHAEMFMSTFSSVRSIPSIGSKTTEALISLKLQSVSDLQQASLSVLRQQFSSDMAVRLLKLSHGEDNAPVKQSGRPLSIGLEDSFKVVSVKSEVEEKFSALLQRLVVLVREDGRVPVSLRVTLRKRDARRLSSHRESRQCQISPSLFTLSGGAPDLTDAGRAKLLATVMRLFNKLVDLNKPFHLTLVGLAFTKFQDRATGRSSIVNYLMNDISVQSVLDLQHECAPTAAMDCASPASSATDLSDAEVEPSPKKPKKVDWTAARRCLRPGGASPSKLRVGELRLSSRELQQVSELRLSSRDRSLPPAEPARSPSPDPPQAAWRSPRAAPHSAPHSAPRAKQNTIVKYFVQNK